MPTRSVPRTLVTLALATLALLPLTAASPGAVSASASGTTDGLQAWGWGFDYKDPLRNGLGVEFPLPVHALPVVQGVGYRTVAMGAGFAVGILSDGSVWQWGALGSKTGAPVRLPLPPGTQFASLVAGDFYVLALDTAGRAWAWGDNESGALGDGTRISRTRPVRVHLPPAVRVVALAAGGSALSARSFAVSSAGHVWHWGAGRLVPALVTGWPSPVPRITSVAAGVDFRMALATDGRVFAWGSNDVGQLGDGTTTGRSTPARVHLPPGIAAASIAAGGYSGFALDGQGQGLAWGDNDLGQLGIGSSEPFQPVPTQMVMPTGVAFTEIDPAFLSAFALDASGAAWGWGNDPVGDGTDQRRDRPTAVRMPDGVAFSSISTGGVAGLAQVMVLGTGSGSADLVLVGPNVGEAGAGFDVGDGIAVGNSGASSAPATLTYRLPRGVVFLSADSTQGSCDRSARIVTCELGSVAIAAIVDIRFHTVVPGVSSVIRASLSPTDGTPADDAATVPFTIVTSSATRYVRVTGAGFSHDAVELVRGRTVDWYFTGRVANGVHDASGLGLFDSGTKTPLADFQHAYPSSGTFAVGDERGHSMRVGVMIGASPKSGTVGQVFGLTWRWVGDLPPGQVHDAQIAYCTDPGCAPPFQDWRVGTLQGSGELSASDPAWHGAGTYFFRARLRDTTTGAASDWSPVRTITVTP